ncbi:MAG: hypothetical protein ACXABY_05400 [Candidatus Thorarchaeota archaeon]|jgi:hypothetical protein
MAYTIGPKFTHVAANTTDELIDSGNAIIVHGIVMTGFSAAATIEVANTTTVVMNLLTGSVVRTVSVNIPFLADKGIQVTTDANSTVTIIHSHAGT